MHTYEALIEHKELGEGDKNKALRGAKPYTLCTTVSFCSAWTTQCGGGLEENRVNV
ncbi:MAG: hypothetical protein ACE5E1_09705 [Phycisphaerae bacterium]